MTNSLHTYPNSKLPLNKVAAMPLNKSMEFTPRHLSSKRLSSRRIDERAPNFASLARHARISARREVATRISPTQQMRTHRLAWRAALRVVIFPLMFDVNTFAMAEFNAEMIEPAVSRSMQRRQRRPITDRHK